jgi:cell division transport system ATP-binding protein
LARAIVNKPAILLADEPTGNLDPNTSADIVNLLEKISQSGTTIVMATHDVGIVNRLKRRVIELKHGVIVRDDKKSGYETALPNTDQVQTIEPAGEEQA